MKKEYVYAFAVEITNTIVAIVLFELAAARWSAAGFGEFALSRRALALLEPLVVVGLSIAIPRFMAQAYRSDSEVGSDSYFIAALIACCSILAITVVNLLLFCRFFASMVFGDAKYAYLIGPLCLTLVGGCLHVMVYSFLRGSGRIPIANLVHLVMYGAFPLLAITLFGNSVVQVLNALGLFSMSFSVIALAVILRNSKYAAARLIKCMRELLAYGVLRVPAALGLSALLTLPAIFAAHLFTIAEAGNIVFAVTVLGVLGSALTPISVVLLPRASRMIAAGFGHDLNKHVSDLVRISLTVSIAYVLFIVFFADEIALMFFNGSAALNAARSVRIISVAAVPYAFFQCVKSVIDAYHFGPINARNIFLSLAAFFAAICVLAVGGWIQGIASILYTFVLALYCLGILSAIEAASIAKDLSVRRPAGAVL